MQKCASKHNKAAYHAAKYKYQEIIRSAKTSYADKFENRLNSCNNCLRCREVRRLLGKRDSPGSTPGTASVGAWLGWSIVPMWLGSSKRTSYKQWSSLLNLCVPCTGCCHAGRPQRFHPCV